jgi:hypothetical protein
VTRLSPHTFYVTRLPSRSVKRKRQFSPHPINFSSIAVTARKKSAAR